MKVTDEMVIRAADVSFPQVASGSYVRAQLRLALEAALADVPEPGELEAKLEKLSRIALDSARTMEQRIDAIQDVLSGAGDG